MKKLNLGTKILVVGRVIQQDKHGFLIEFESSQESAWVNKQDLSLASRVRRTNK